MQIRRPTSNGAHTIQRCTNCRSVSLLLLTHFASTFEYEFLCDPREESREKREEREEEFENRRGKNEREVENKQENELTESFVLYVTKIMNCIII